MAKQHDKQFKLDAVQYYQDHKDLGVRGCAENLGIGYSTLTKWLKDFRESGDIPVRGSGNYASDEQKEIARLRRELLSGGKLSFPPTVNFPQIKFGSVSILSLSTCCILQHVFICPLDQIDIFPYSLIV